MTGVFRRVWRVTALVALVCCALPVYPLFWLRGSRGGAAANVLWLHWILRCALRIAGGRLGVRGDPPRSGLVVSNHLSYADIATLGAACPCSFVSKAEVKAWPLIGWAATLAGTVFVRRAHRREVAGQVEDIKQALSRGVPIVLFPEGTSTDGSQVLPFRSALLQAALEAGCDVTPVALAYDTDPPGDAVRDICWWGGVGFLPHVWRLLSLKNFRAGVVFGASRRVGTDRKSGAASLRDEVLRLKGR